jgi:hypothetical protein
MTDEDLRTLLHERVEDVTTTDLSGGAWHAGRRIRTRRRLGAVAGVVAGVLVIAGVAVAVGGQPASESDPDPSTSTATVDEADAVVQGAPVFWSPEPAEEDDLEAPEEDGVLPELVDLTAGAPSVEDAPITRADAAFGVYEAERLDRIVLLTPDGYRTLEPFAGARPTTGMLSADGRSLHMSGPGGVAATYSFASGQWLGERVANDPPPEVPAQVVEADAYGSPKQDPSGARTAQAYGWGSRVPAAPGALPRPETVVVTPTLGPPTILALTDSGRDRRNQCCAVAGWIGDDTVVYESRTNAPKLIGWHVGTHDFELVSRIVGLAAADSYVASFADLRGDTGPAPSDSEPDVTATTDADASVRGLSVWWGPDVKTEADLPWRDSGSLPSEIDLDPGAPPATDLDTARGVFAVFAGGSLERVVVLAPDGSSRLLDASRLEPVRDEAGNTAALLPTDGGLSPDGRYVFFAQNSSIEVYEFATATWLTIDTEDWLAEGARWSGPGSIWIPDALGSESGTAYRPDGGPLGGSVVDGKSALGSGGEPYGPLKVVRSAIAQTFRLDGPVPSPADASVSNPEAVVVRQGDRSLALALPDLGRAKGCCPVAGLLDAGTVVFHSEDRLLAWDVGTHDVQLVAVITGRTSGEAYVVSFADLTEP